MTEPVTFGRGVIPWNGANTGIEIRLVRAAAKTAKDGGRFITTEFRFSLLILFTDEVAEDGKLAFSSNGVECSVSRINKRGRAQGPIFIKLQCPRGIVLNANNPPARRLRVGVRWRRSSSSVEKPHFLLRATSASRESSEAILITQFGNDRVGCELESRG